jgi:hypothetical protein
MFVSLCCNQDLEWTTPLSKNGRTPDVCPLDIDSIARFLSSFVSKLDTFLQVLSPTLPSIIMVVPAPDITTRFGLNLEYLKYLQSI